ncbi:hypothetical protein [Qipengyuania sp.]|uniref:hypothetical protein n=1 Tax=Qipengyuania sp. TaxID=2004515 RepID=UPI0035C7D0C7
MRGFAMMALAALAALAGTGSPALARSDGEAAPDAGAGAGVDPLSVTVESADADRFAAVFAAADGRPTAEALQRGYLDGAGRGVAVFTPGRIQNAANLARAIAADPAGYARAVKVCLPLAKQASADMRAIYLGLASVFPGRPLPELHVVFGAGNSGGTAGVEDGVGAQVLGLEVICEMADTPEELRTTFRRFFAHETVHVVQMQAGAAVQSASDPLLAASLTEGFAEFVSGLVTGEVPDPERDGWARAREAQVWADFAADRRALQIMAGEGMSVDDPPAEAAALLRRWAGNYGSAPEGWPYEMGYWIGRRICEGYFERSTDKRRAIEDLLLMKDPAAILAGSGYGSRVEFPSE